MGAVHKVLVVDDDPVIAKSFERVLSGKGYAVISAGSGAEALKTLAAEDYDVVYTDIRTPGMSGLDVAVQIKAQRPWIPVVIITDESNAEDEARAKAAGVAAFLNKPLSPDMIEESAAAALRSAGTAVPREAPAAARGGVAARLKTCMSATLGGLAFVIAFPVVALASFVWLGLREGGRHEGTRGLTNIVLLLASPFVAAACMAALPIVGGWALISLVDQTVGRATVRREAHEAVKRIGRVGPLIALAYVMYPAVFATLFVVHGVRAWIAQPA